MGDSGRGATWVVKDFLKGTASARRVRGDTQRTNQIRIPMNIKSHLSIAASALIASLATGSAATLTDITVFGVFSDGNWANHNVWETRPGNNFNVWIQAGPSGGPFLTGPTDAAAQPSVALSPGGTSFRLLGAPGEDHPYFGINLFFDGATTPSISAFGPMLTSVGPHSFSANGAGNTASPTTFPLIPGAGPAQFHLGRRTDHADRLLLGKSGRLQSGYPPDQPRPARTAALITSAASRCPSPPCRNRRAASIC